MASDGPAEGYELVGTSRLSKSGGSGRFTVPKDVFEPLLDDYGRDYAMFSDGESVLIVPAQEVEVDV